LARHSGRGVAFGDKLVDRRLARKIIVAVTWVADPVDATDDNVGTAYTVGSIGNRTRVAAGGRVVDGRALGAGECGRCHEEGSRDE